MPYTLDESESVADLLGFKKPRAKSPAGQSKVGVVRPRKGNATAPVLKRRKALTPIPQSR